MVYADTGADTDSAFNMAMKAIRGMVGGAINEFSTAVGGSKTAASREHALAVSRDYISQPRLSKCH